MTTEEEANLKFNWVLPDYKSDCAGKWAVCSLRCIDPLRVHENVPSQDHNLRPMYDKSYKTAAEKKVDDDHCELCDAL